MASKKIEALADWLFDVTKGKKPWQDILEKDPKLSIDDAYAVQFALMKRIQKAGDPVIGYKAALTSIAMQKERGVDEPIMGALLQSALRQESDVIDIVKNARNAVEAEVGVLLKKDLEGPGVTPYDAYNAVECYMAAIEVAVAASGGKRSHHMGIAGQKTTGTVLFGSNMVSPRGIDLKVEGTVLSINGQVRASATAVEVLGNPLNSIAYIANRAAANGEKLKAGMVLITGSICPAFEVKSGDESRMDFTNLGTVSCRFK